MNDFVYLLVGSIQIQIIQDPLISHTEYRPVHTTYMDLYEAKLRIIFSHIVNSVIIIVCHARVRDSILLVWWRRHELFGQEGGLLGVRAFSVHGEQPEKRATRPVGKGTLTEPNHQHSCLDCARASVAPLNRAMLTPLPRAPRVLGPLPASLRAPA